MQIIGDLAALALFVVAAYGMAGLISRMPRTPAPVRRAADRTRDTIRNPGRAARRAGNGAEAIWAKARSEDWLERRRATRERRAAGQSGGQRAGRAVQAAGRGLRKIRRPRVAFLLPGVTDRPRSPAKLSVVPHVEDGPPMKATAPANGSGPAPQAASPSNTPPAIPAKGQLTTERRLVMPAGTPTDYAAIAGRIAAFEPESDAELLHFMTGEAAGLAALAQAMEQQAETLVNGTGLDPSSVAGIGDYANALTEAAALMVQANRRFQATYQGVRETVAAGTVLPYSGRFMTGEGS